MILKVRYFLRKSKSMNLFIQICLILLIICGVWQVRSTTGGDAVIDKLVPHSDETLQEPATTETEPLQGLQRLKDGVSISNNIRTRSFFPSHFYPEKIASELSIFKNFGKHDPRLLPALYMNIINRELVDKKELPEDFKLPFNWNMLTDSVSKIMNNPLYDSVIKKRLTCLAIGKILNFPFRRLLCKEFVEGNALDVYGLGVEISGNALTYFTDPEMRKLYANIHDLSGFKLPDNIVFVGALKDRSLKIPVESMEDGKQNLVNGVLDQLTLGINVLVQQFIDDLQQTKDIQKILLDGIQGFEQMNQFEQLAALSKIPEQFLLSAPDNSILEPLPLDASYFDLNLTQEIEKLPESVELRQFLTDTLDPSFAEVKHFGESYLKEKKAESGHFDWRFFGGLTRDRPKLHQATIHRMLRTWFKFARDLGVHSWMNHGSLIGFYFNGYTLPYDNDIDVQVPIQSLIKLALEANNSIIFDMTNNDFVDEEFQIDSKAEIGFRSYYLDINPWIGARSKYKNNKNLIDARFIDVFTGNYIDITALASFHSYTQRDPQIQMEIMEKFDAKDNPKVALALRYDDFYAGVVPKELFKVKNRAELKRVIRLKTEDKVKELKTEYQEQLAKDGNLPTMFDNMVNCRNHHFYNLQEFLPLIPIYFENTPVYIASSWLKDMVIEYDHRVLDSTLFRGHRYVPTMNMWIPNTVCETSGKDFEKIRDECIAKDEFVRAEYHRLQPYTESTHNLMSLLLPFNDLKKDVTRIEDTFAIRHYNRRKFEKLLSQFDGQVLRPEPWIAQYLFN